MLLIIILFQYWTSQILLNSTVIYIAHWDAPVDQIPFPTHIIFSILGKSVFDRVWIGTYSILSNSAVTRIALQFLMILYQQFRLTRRGKDEIWKPLSFTKHRLNLYRVMFNIMMSCSSFVHFWCIMRTPLKTTRFN